MKLTKLQSQIRRPIAILLVMVMALAQPYSIAYATDPPADPPPAQTETPADTSETPPPAQTETPAEEPAVTPTPAPAPAPAPSPPPAPPAQPEAAAEVTATQGPTSATGPTGPTGPNGPTGRIPTYAFNDALQKWEPTITSSFKWSETEHNWVSPFYRFNPVVGWWHTIPNVTPSDSINALTKNSSDPSALLQRILGVSDPANSSTGPNSVNDASVNDTESVLVTLLTNSGIYNDISSSAASGDASVSGNTSAGDARTGLATIVANLLNLLNAMWSFGSGGLAYFIENIYGNQTGDIAINPQTVSGGGGQLGQCSGGLATNTATGPGSTNVANQNCSRDLEVNNQVNGTIVNDVEINASSGNASVSGNTSAGNAVSGDVLAQLNIINLINTAIGAGQSFFGIINIFGNLNGDILFPSLNLNGVVQSSQPGSIVMGNTSTGPGSSNTASNSTTNSLEINNEVNGAFNNNIESNATSGDASVSHNTEAGSATSGNTKTNTSLFNLFNMNIFGDNAVLVIVNNLGKWYGTIMNLGGDGTSAGGLLTSNAVVVQNSNTGPDSTNEASVSNSNTAEINNEVNGSITNNVTINATSGAATVENNTKAGNATSGSATIASSIANIFNSTLSFGKVFGVLFINVFGSWTGSAGIDTAAGNAPAPVSPVQDASHQGVGGGLVSGLGGSSLASLPGALAHSVLGTGGNNTSGVGGLVSNVQSLPDAVQAAIHDKKEAVAQTNSAGMMMVLAAIMLLLAGAGLSAERKLRASGRQ